MIETDPQLGTFNITARLLKLVNDMPGASDAKGETVGAVAVLRDIGETKVLQRRNAEFVSSVSHEMKTPLSGVKAYVELLADGEAEDDATREEFLKVISSQADRLHRLVENLLNLARMEAGVVKVDKPSRISNTTVSNPALESQKAVATPTIPPPTTTTSAVQGKVTSVGT